MRVGIDLLFESSSCLASARARDLVAALCELASARKDLGIEICVLARPDWEAPTQFTGSWFRVDRGSTRLPTRVGEWRDDRTRKRWIHDRHPDLVHFFGSRPVRLDVPTIWTVPDRCESMRRPEVQRRTASRGMLADQVIVASRALRTALLTWVPDMSADRVHQVPPGPAPGCDSGRDEAAEARIRERYRLPDRFVLVPFSSDARPALDRTLRAMREVAQHEPDLLFALLPDAPLHDFLAARLETNGLQRFARFLDGITPNGRPHVARMAEAVLLPGNEPADLIDQLSCGAPVVAWAHGTFRELAERAVRLAPIGDASALAECVLDAWRDESLRHLLRSRAARRAPDFSWHRVSELTCAVYLLAHGVPAGRLPELFALESIVKNASDGPIIILAEDDDNEPNRLDRGDAPPSDAEVGSASAHED